MKTILIVLVFKSVFGATEDDGGDKKCVHEWRKFNYDREPELDGFDIGLYQPGIRSYIGRGWYWNSKVPGRIQITGNVGCYIVSDWRVKKPDRDVEFLVKNPHYDYHWVNSSEGVNVKNQVLVGRRLEGGGFWRIGRILDGNFTYLAKVFNGGAHYESGDGRELMAGNYQILTCEVGGRMEEIKDTEILVLVIFLALLFTILIVVLAYFGILYKHRYLKFGDVIGFQKM